MLSLIEVDKETDAAYISLRPELRDRSALINRSVRVGDVVLDLAEDGQLVGIRLFQASKYLGEDFGEGLRDAIIGVKGAADLLQVEKSNFVRDYANKPGFPSPIAELGSGRFWIRAAIEKYRAERDAPQALSRTRTAAAPRAGHSATTATAIEIPAPVSRGQLPEYWRFGALVFQQLCSELHQKEKHVSTAYVFGTNGQAQRGVDILAYRAGDT